MNVMMEEGRITVSRAVRFSCQAFHSVVAFVTMCLFTLNINDNDTNNRIQRHNSRYFTISLLRCELSPTRTLKWPGRNRVQITCNTSSAHHVQHVVLCATWYEGTAQLLSLTELKSHVFELYFIG